MNWSIGLRAHEKFAGTGASGRAAAAYDQCVSHFAPSSIQRRSMPICASVSACPESGGGMRSSGSGSRIFFTSTLLAALPGTMMPSSAKAPSRVSKRNLVSRCFSSGPWQAKQLLDRIGRMSRLKLSGAAGRVSCARPATTHGAGQDNAATGRHRGGPGARG